MNKRKIHIGNLQIRLPRSAAGQARSIAAGLGTEILQSIAGSTSGETGKKRVGQISAGKIISTEAGVPDLQKQIARKVAEELVKRFE
jgi:hypothetical protein